MKWELVVVTDSGREIPHWESRTREGCRAEARRLRAQGHSPPLKIRRKGR